MFIVSENQASLLMLKSWLHQRCRVNLSKTECRLLQALLKVIWEKATSAFSPCFKADLFLSPFVRRNSCPCVSCCSDVRMWHGTREHTREGSSKSWIPHHLGFVY